MSQNIDKNREELRQRLNVAPDRRIESANQYLKAWKTARDYATRETTTEAEAYHSYLSGWDDAMVVSKPELTIELATVREKLDDLIIERFQAEKLLPELLAACKELLDMIDHQETGDFQKECWCTETDTGYGTLVCGACRARAAIAKVEELTAP